MDDDKDRAVGWYPHPEYPEKNRYWNGFAWTDANLQQDASAPRSDLPSAPAVAATRGVGCFGIGCLSIVGVVVLIGIVTAISTSTQSDAERHDDPSYATVLCQDEVRTALKSPTSASFTNVEAVTSTSLIWTVAGDVDAQNSFGAAIRNHFVCTMEVRESDGFTRISLDSLG